MHRTDAIFLCLSRHRQHLFGLNLFGTRYNRFAHLFALNAVYSAEVENTLRIRCRISLHSLLTSHHNDSNVNGLRCRHLRTDYCVTRAHAPNTYKNNVRRTSDDRRTIRPTPEAAKHCITFFVVVIFGLTLTNNMHQNIYHAEGEPITKYVISGVRAVVATVAANHSYEELNAIE